mmetsp:Transcript_19180/g.39138  ORF Transcript_19180/g.39138 Transcript_19180/m.39138 type:complete len:221 (+) Transcript_19180:2007-2669(+)
MREQTTTPYVTTTAGKCMMDDMADVIVACITEATPETQVHPGCVHMGVHVGRDGYVHTALFQRRAWIEPRSVMFDMYPQHCKFIVMLKLRMLSSAWRDAVAMANPPVAYVGRLESYLHGQRVLERMRIEADETPELCMLCNDDATEPVALSVALDSGMNGRVAAARAIFPHECEPEICTVCHLPTSTSCYYPYCTTFFALHPSFCACLADGYDSDWSDVN